MFLLGVFLKSIFLYRPITKKTESSASRVHKISKCIMPITHEVLGTAQY